MRLRTTPKGIAAKLFKKDALADLDDVTKNISYNGNVLIGRSEGIGGRELTLGEVSNVSAVTEGRNITLNPNGYAFVDTSKTFMNEAGKRYIEGLNKIYSDAGASNQWQFAIAVIIHEYLHTTGKFNPDSKSGADGSVNSKKSQEYQKEVLEKCKKEIAGVKEPGN